MDCPCSGGVKYKSVNGSSVLSCCEGNTVALLSLEYTSKRSVFLFEMFKMSMSGCGNSYTMVLSESSLSLSCVGVSVRVIGVCDVDAYVASVNGVDVSGVGSVVCCVGFDTCGVQRFSNSRHRGVPLRASLTSGNRWHGPFTNTSTLQTW